MSNEPKVHNRHYQTAPANAVYIGRGSPWGNPYSHMNYSKAKHIVSTREEAIELFRINVLPKLDLRPLRGRHLVCFCKPKACHGDLLLEAANKKEGATT